VKQDRPVVVAVLDDEEQMRKALRRLLCTHGFEVETYATGDALMADLPSPRLDCLLLDLHMPGLDGFAVLRAFANRSLVLPIIAITGHDMPGNAERVLKLGAAAYLLKPVDETLLVATIHSVL
jgi:FixJ family two-component response regulator